MKINPNLIKDISGTILWENPNPSASSFNAQNILLSSSDYDCYEIIYMFSTTNTNCTNTGKIPKGKGTMMVFLINVGGIHGNTTRNVNYSDATHLSFETAQDDSGNSITNRCIPLYVIGYKTGNF